MNWSITRKAEMAARRNRQLIPAGSRAPDFRLRRLDGGEARLVELLENGPVLLAFFKISCPVCQLTLPYFDRIYASGRLPVFGISQNEPGGTAEFNRRFDISFPSLLDSEDDGFPASNAYGISSVPTSFLVERDGVISRVVEGWQKTETERLAGLAGVNPFWQDEYVPEWKSG